MIFARFLSRRLKGSSIMATPVETIPEAAELSLTDRCDACGAAAKVRVRKLYTGPDAPSTGVLLFCGHHSTKHGPALIAQGWALH